MAVLCRRCMTEMSLTRPPVRTRTAPCDKCGSQNEDPKGRNYDYPDKLVPGNVNEPNAVADREQAGV